MPYIGNVPAEAYSQVSYQDLTGGSGTSFTLDYPVGSAGEIEVFVNNVRQEPTVAYTVSGTALTMTGSVAATDDFYVVFQGKAEKSGTIPEKQTDGTYVFPDDVTVSGNITSTGIDDNSTSTAITLDSSGNLLVGKSSASTSSVGVEALANGEMNATVSGGRVGLFNRLTSDGDIVQFRKDNNTVGIIGVKTSDLYIGKAESGLLFDVTGADGIRPFNTTAQGESDGNLDLGSGSARFKNLYLSSGVYLGGITADNALTDYEFGFFEPSLIGSTSDPTVTWDTIVGQEGWYVKVGRMVHIQINFRTDSVSGGSGNLYVGNLPFTSPAVAGQGGMASFAVARTSSWPGNTPSAAYINEGTNYIILEYRTSANGSASTVQVSDLGTGTNDNLLCISGTYYTTQ
jgi:hypothetical protein